MLTLRKQQILDAITDYIREHGYSPTLREITKIVHISSSTLYGHLKDLEKKGYIFRKYNQGRSVMPMPALSLQLNNAIRAYQTAFGAKHGLALVRTDKHYISSFISKTMGTQYKISLADMAYDIDKIVPSPLILRWAKSPSDETFQFYTRKYGKMLDT